MYLFQRVISLEVSGFRCPGSESAESCISWPSPPGHKMAVRAPSITFSPKQKGMGRAKKALWVVSLIGVESASLKLPEDVLL